MSKQKVVVIIGLQDGDEGKGRITAQLSADGRNWLVARANGGANAGHTVITDVTVRDPSTGYTTCKETKFALHQLTSASVNENTYSLLGFGMVIDPVALCAEMKDIEAKGIRNVAGRVRISNRVHVVLPYHKVIEAKNEQSRLQTEGKAIGTTGKGIGPCYTTKASRQGFTLSQLYSDWDMFLDRYKERFGAEAPLSQEYIESLESALEFIRGCVVADHYTLLEEAPNLIMEGAQAVGIDTDRGKYPYVTSSKCDLAGQYAGLGYVPPKDAEVTVVGIIKGYGTSVGERPILTEDGSEELVQLQQMGREFGTTTGRARRVFWADAVQIKANMRGNQITFLALNKLDILGTLKDIKVCVAYQNINTGAILRDVLPSSNEEYSDFQPIYQTFPGDWGEISHIRDFESLPTQCKNFVLCMEVLVSCKIKYIGVGPKQDQLIIRA